MATKTIINCIDQSSAISTASSTSTVPQSISIKIDPSIAEPTSQPASLASVTNVIKIQHSCQATSPPTRTPSSSASPPSMPTTLNSLSNKLLIDINQQEEAINNGFDDHHQAKESSLLSTAIVKVNCVTSSGIYSREQAEDVPLGASIKLEIQANGAISRERKVNDKGDDDEGHGNNDVGQEKENSLLDTRRFDESGPTAKIQHSHTISTDTTTITTKSSSSSSSSSSSAFACPSSSLATIATTTSQQVNNGNSKRRENDGQFHTNQTNKPSTNGQQANHNDDVNDDERSHHNDHHYNDNNDVNDHDDDDDDDDDGPKSTGIGKRDSCLDFSHAGGKRWPGQENSNSLLTKADTATSSTTISSSSSTTTNINTTSHQTLTQSVIINENANRKENCNEPKEENLKSHSNVVKIQINPSTKYPNNHGGLEKQISIVKIESNLVANKSEDPNESVEEVPKKAKENQKESEEIFSETEKKISAQSSELVRKSELHLNLEKMVQQRPQQQNSVVTAHAATAASANGNGGAATTTTANANGSTTVTELNVTNPNYLFYSSMSSGQFSPCDTLDSGTGSDLENHNHHSSASPKAHLLMAKKPSSNANTVNGLEMHLKTTKIRVASSANGKEQRTCSSYTDSEESEASSLSCDSLHSSEFMRQSSASPLHNKTPSPSSKILGSYLPDSLLREIKNLKLNHNEYEAENEHDEEEEEEEEEDEHIEQRLHKRNAEPLRSQDYMVAQNDYVQRRNNDNSNSHSNSSANANTLSNTSKRASLPSKTFVLNQEDGTFIDMKMNSMPRKYEADKYYNFHVNEHENFRSFGNNSGVPSFGDGSGSDSFSMSDYEGRSIHDDVFAGYKDIRCGSATSTIRSNKGTVRGVKNRVRNGIATFLQLQHPNIKNFKEKDSGKVVLYTTSMGIIRDTYAKCSNVKQILRTLLVKFEERDVFMSVEYQQEIKERMHSETIQVPQLFVEGQHIGDADAVERLNESGELRQLLKAYKSIATTYTCQTCGGYRLLPCPSCKGSKKSVHRNHFTAEFVALKCMNCDEVGLVKCHNC
uniref:Glutaredoxin domain-containing protein n=1 Tax=Stomoxys calcitrans TaxID=35570 RepID=A0A1I8P8W2_STOCA